ncbi:MAG: hypothetical protein ACK2UK_19440 [Candidatus Promineifilaceae bacterium]
MTNQDKFTKALAIVGTVLLWLPLLAPLLLGLYSLAQDGIYRLDYLMPAELFALVLAGGALLVWAARRAHAYFGQVAIGLLVAALALVAVQVTAEITGLASGATEVGGWQWALTLGLLALYILAVAATAVYGLLLLRRLFQPPLPQMR